LSDTAPRSVITRALALLDAFQETETTLPVAELVRRVGLPKTTVHRMVADLVHHGLLERSGREVGLGVHLFELGCRVPARRRLRESGVPYMQDLYAAAHEGVLMGVLDGRDVLCIARVNGHDAPGVTMSEGDRAPAHATAMGKAMLAFSPRGAVARVIDAGLCPLTPYTIVVPEVLLGDLAQTCRTGVAFAREEEVLGTAAVAAPILGGGRDVLGSLSVSGPTRRFEPTRLADAVRVTAAGIGRRLGEVSSYFETLRSPGRRRALRSPCEARSFDGSR
jgi:DNA-binding IclR family transcriptional regulator